MSDDVFRWVIAAAVMVTCMAFLLQAGVVLSLYRIARQIQAKVAPLVDRTEPILNSTRQILEESRPRISEISVQAVEIAKTVRAQTDRIGEVLAESADRAKTRIEQIDKTVDQTVEQVEHMGGAVKIAVMKPVREVNGLVAGLKAAVSSYAAGGRRSSVDHATQDEEMFI
jgi:methyl-accepting chemotaxis protein